MLIRYQNLKIKIMNKKPFLIIAILTFSVPAVVAQSTEEEVLKKLVRLETETYQKKDSVAWKALFIQDEKTNRMYAGNGFYYNGIGWDSFGPMMLQWMKEDPKPSRYTDIQHTNYIIKVSENLAWLGYDQKLNVPGNDSLPGTSTREFRTLVKDNNQWKISSIITIDTLSFSTDPYYVENLFNATGYAFLHEKKIDEAIEIFKLNVKLYPEAWNTHDSLGEAYAAAGDKKKSMKCYEKSIQLNPDNNTGKEILAKLKKE